MMDLLIAGLRTDLSTGEGPGLALAIALIVALLALLPSGERRLVRQPIGHLLAHLTALVLGHLPTSAGWLRGTLAIVAVVLLLASIGRSSVLLVFDIGLARRLTRPVPKITRDLVQGLVYTLIALASLRAAGIALDSILTTSALITAVIGLSLQETLGNLFAGLAMQLQRPFEVGDWIQFEPDPKRIGRVLEINWRATKVQTLDDVEIIVPNGTLGKAAIVNHSRPRPETRRSVYFEAPYDVPPKKVHAAVLAALKQCPRVVREPPPNIVTSGFKESGIEYWVRFWTTHFGERDGVDGDVRDRIWYALSRAEIEFAFPTRNVFLHEVSDDSRDQAARSRHRDRVAALGAVDFLAALSDDERDLLADLAQERLYTAGEAIVTIGDKSSELFIVTHGTATVLAPDARGQLVEVGYVGAGHFFGEMALMTGEARNASVVSAGESKVIAIGHDAFKTTLDAHPSLAETMSRVLVERQARLQAHATRRTDEPADAADERSSELLSRIRAFFAL